MEFYEVKLLSNAQALLVNTWSFAKQTLPSNAQALPLPPWTFASEDFTFECKLQTTEKPLGFSVVELFPKP